MGRLHDMAEARIRDAIEEGQFDDLPGKGEPLVLDDDSRVPADLRGAYRVLKNAGLLPEEMELKQSMVTLRSLIDAAVEDDERARMESELRDMTIRFDILMQRRRGAGLRLGSYRSAAASRLLGR